MSTEPVDVPDLIPCHELVYDENNEERPPWKFCNSLKIPRSEVVFFGQTLVCLLVITFCLIKLAFFDVSCDDRPFWTSLLWGAVGYLMPNPKP